MGQKQLDYKRELKRAWDLRPKLFLMSNLQNTLVF